MPNSHGTEVALVPHAPSYPARYAGLGGIRAAMVNAPCPFKELRAWRENGGTVVSPGLGGIPRQVGAGLGERFTGQ